MNNEMKRFDADVKKDPALLAEFKAKVKDNGTLIAFANSKGYTFGAQDVAALKGELSEKDLDKVAGGSGADARLSFLVQGGAQYLTDDLAKYGIII